VIALLSAVGSGKSATISLIPRLYDISAGCLSIDGHDTTCVPGSCWQDGKGFRCQ